MTIAQVPLSKAQTTADQTLYNEQLPGVRESQKKCIVPGLIKPKMYAYYVLQ